MLGVRVFLVFVLILLLGGAIFFAMREFAGPVLADVKAVPRGDQEVAWIAPATSVDAWERMVAAVKQLGTDWARVHGGRDLAVSLDKAFLNLTAAVPEVALQFTGSNGKLWIRWYKLSGENDQRTWVERLIQRGTPPLAIIGGETTDRALALARVLKEVEKRWPGPDPLFLVTTATADGYLSREQNLQLPHDKWPKLIDVYSGRTFRFSFTNTRMVNAVLDFVRQTPQVCLRKHYEPATLAGLAGQGSALGALAAMVGAGHWQPSFLYSVVWLDNGYSQDLAEIFLEQYIQRQRPAGSEAPVTTWRNNVVDYSVGDFVQPNPRESFAVDFFLDIPNEVPNFKDYHQLVVLPTGAQQARRFLRTLCRRAPKDVRSVVVITGDAITFNNVYRDRDIAWNIQDMPVPLVFFTHRNPVDPQAGFLATNAEGQRSTTATQDLLLHRDIIEGLLLAAFDQDSWRSDADQVRERLRQTRWHQGRLSRGAAGQPFFAPSGNRNPGTGEHVVWLRPAIEGPRNLPVATLTVWTVDYAPPRNSYRLFGEPLEVYYNRSSE